MNTKKENTLKEDTKNKKKIQTSNIDKKVKNNKEKENLKNKKETEEKKYIDNKLKEKSNKKEQTKKAHEKKIIEVEPIKTESDIVEKNKKDYFKNSEVIFLVALTCIVSIIMGFSICFKINFNEDNIKVDDDLKKILDVYDKIKDDYYRDIDKNKLINGAIDGMLKELGDDYSTIINDDSKSTFDARLEGKYSGLGIEVSNNNDNDIIIVNVFKNSSADLEGIKAGDIIIKIDDNDLKGKTSTELVNYISDTNKKQYKVTIIRDGKEIEKDLTKKTITIDSVSSKLYEKNNKKIGYIKIDIFSKMASTQFQKQLIELEDKKIDSLIIDVRDNTGGYLTTASSIVSEFLDKDNIIYKTDKKGEVISFYSNGNITKKYPIVILQNEISASAAELLSIALKEQYKATVIGKKSYGKGTIQELIKTEDGIEYKYTTKKWLSPSGKWINEIGVIPDIDIELSDDYKNNPIEENDNQLNKALSLLAE